jgi:uncharacterized protein (TIGR03032 family)
MNETTAPPAERRTDVVVSASPGVAGWLRAIKGALVFSTYELGRLFVLGVDEAGAIALSETGVPRCMGLTVDGRSLLVAAKNRIWRFTDILPGGQRYQGHDRLYLPRAAHVTGNIDAHELAVDRAGRIVVVNTLFSCLAVAGGAEAFQPMWKPSFVSALAHEDRCHLNGLALVDGWARHVTCVAASDTREGWRAGRADGGLVIDIADDRVVARGLSMPHSPRWHQGRLWLLNAGRGEFGHVEADGSFRAVAFCPGFLRGLTFVGGLAVIGVSQPRHETFAGLPLDDELRRRGLEPMAGILVIDPASGRVVHSLRITEGIRELFDVAVLPGTVHPKLVGPDDEEADFLVDLGAPAPRAAPQGAAASSRDPASSPGSGPGRDGAALEAMREAVLMQPGHAGPHINLGNQFRAMGRFEDARFQHRLAITLDPGSAVARLNLGNAHHDLGQPGPAARAYAQAIACAPGLAEAWVALGAELQGAFRLIDAAGFFRRALELRPALAEAHAGLGKTYRLMGEPDDALACLRRAVELSPDTAANGILLLNTMLYADRCGNDELFEAHRSWSARLPGRGLPGRGAGTADHANPQDPARRLRLAYLSADFCDHPVGRMLAPLLEHRDRAGFEMICYAEDRRTDEMTARFRALADGWRSTVGLSDQGVAELIRSDRIDILVCLAGHTAHQRMAAAVYRPAPVQVNMFDLTTSGMPELDYWITDRHMHPPGPHPRGTTERFTERLIRLPLHYIQAPPEGLPPIGPPPSAERGFVRFASFNNPAKMPPTVIALWARVLKAVPGARLLLHYLGQFDDPAFRDLMRHRFAGHGVDPTRVEFGPGDLPRSRHLELYNDVDIALDTFPFNGATTTFEALAMGVPVVTLVGDRFMARMGFMLLGAVGLGALAQPDPAAFAAAAADLAGDAAQRATLRRELRQRVARSALCDAAGRARQLERAYRAMWRRWCMRHPVARG